VESRDLFGEVRAALRKRRDLLGPVEPGKRDKRECELATLFVETLSKVAHNVLSEGDQLRLPNFCDISPVFNKPGELTFSFTVRDRFAREVRRCMARSGLWGKDIEPGSLRSDGDGRASVAATNEDRLPYAVRFGA